MNVFCLFSYVKEIHYIPKCIWSTAPQRETGDFDVWVYIHLRGRYCVGKATKVVSHADLTLPRKCIIYPLPVPRKQEVWMHVSLAGILGSPVDELGV